MYRTICLMLLFTLSFLNGCSAMPAPETRPSILEPPLSQYDTRIVDPDSGQLLTTDQLARQLADADVVVVGEYHGHHGSHLLQARLQQALHRIRPAQVLSLEQFNVDHQQALSQYLEGSTGETEMIEDAEAWDNYRASYRPLIEFARQQDLPVIAANAPAHVVRCVGRQGPAHLDTLSDPMRRLLPEAPFMDTPAYRDKFMAAIGASHQADATMSERLENTYKAQLLRDNTMAARILEARKTHPGHQILHLTGTFHSEERLGTVALLKQRAPAVSVAVLSPVFWPKDTATPPIGENAGKGDVLYFIQPLPEEFRDPDRAREAMAARFRQAADKSCD